MSKRIPIHEATADQLRKFAQMQNLAISPNPNTGPDKIAAVIRQAGFEEIEVQDDPPEAVQAQSAPQPSSRAMAAQDHGDVPLVEVLIERDEGVGGDRPVFLSVNGRGLLVERGKPQKIKYPYFLALQNAVKTAIDQDPNSGETMTREVPSYNWRVTRMPPQEQIDAWEAKEAETAAAADKETHKRIERRQARAEAAA